MILTYMEIRENKIKKASLEALSEAKRRADDLDVECGAVLLGKDIKGFTEEAFKYGASKVYLLEDPLLENYSSSLFIKAISEVINEIKPKAVFFSATAMGKDLAPRLAAKLDVGVATDCTRTYTKESELEVVRPIFAGKAFAAFRFLSEPHIASLRPNVFPLIEPLSEKGEVIEKKPEISQDQAKEQIFEIKREEGAELDVTEAEVVISGGAIPFKKNIL